MIHILVSIEIFLGNRPIAEKLKPTEQTLQLHPFSSLYLCLQHLNHIFLRRVLFVLRL